MASATSSTGPGPPPSSLAAMLEKKILATLKISHDMAANSSNATTAMKTAKISAKTAPELAIRIRESTTRATQTSPALRLPSKVSPRLAATMTLTTAVSTRRKRTLGVTLRNPSKEDTLAMVLTKTTLLKRSNDLVSQISVRDLPPKRLHRLLSQVGAATSR
jgi:hypothetical protein